MIQRLEFYQDVCLCGQPRFALLPPRCIIQVLVATIDGRRRCILVRSSSSLAALRQEIQRQAAVPVDQQRLLVLQQKALNPPQRVLWALLRLLLAVLLWAGGWLLAGLRLALGLPPASDVRLQLMTESGREVRIAVSPDTTLQQLQRIVWEKHGEQLSLQQLLSVSPSKVGSSSPEKRFPSKGGGGSGSQQLGGSPQPSCTLPG